MLQVLEGKKIPEFSSSEKREKKKKEPEEQKGKGISSITKKRGLVS